MEYQQFIIAFCFYSLFITFVEQSQLTFAGQHLCARDEAFYLLQFKRALTINPDAFNYCDNKTLSWNVSTGDCCEWDGVTCNGFTGHVIGLDLSENCLNGTIHANNSLTKLGHLQRLNLAFNYLDDFPLGNSISELGSLTHLNLSFSGFNKGKMIPPGLSKLFKLVSLDLSSSYFQFGPTTFRNLLQNLTNLEVLLIDDVYAPFELPKNFPSSLRILSLRGTKMFGKVPDTIGNLTAMRELRLSRNNFTGDVLSTISKLNKLVVLDLSSNHFRSPIQEYIGNLTAIRELRLSGNNFTGNVVSTISKLNKLVVLDLSYNHFRGPIPESIGNLTRITDLTLSHNSFTGNVPSTIGKLKTLDYLSLSSNNFEGPIPDIFSNFSGLSDLQFDNNNFSGPFPYSMATLTRLVRLELQNNSLTGPFPPNISGLQDLLLLDLSFNYFTGTTPPWLFRLPFLMFLYLQNNQLTGNLPNEFKSNHTEYRVIDLSYNKLQGEIPDWMLSLRVGLLDLSHNFLTGFEKQVWRTKDLINLNLENNFLQGPLHQSICDMIYLQVLILAQNNFSGSIPGCLGNSSSPISIVDLRMNNFHGDIPRFLPIGLQYLGLYGNQLGGQVPRSLVNCTSLKALDLGNNKINDTFPIWLEKLPNLQVLILKSNLFHGQLGNLESEFPFPELRIFDLSFNGFTGTLPSNLFESFRGLMDVDEETTGIMRGKNITDTGNYLYHVSLVIKGNAYDMRITPIMTSVDLSSNRFEGDIPNSIGSLSSLVLLNLSHNSFRGHIPTEIAKLQALEALDLSWNRLLGEIPGPLSSLTFLEVLNLSYNHLSGRIPIGKQFNTFSNDSYCGNLDLCGFPLSNECGNSNESPPEQDDDDNSFFARGFTWEAVVTGYGCGIAVGLFIGGLMFLLEKPKWVVNFAEDIAQQIVAKKKRRQRKRRQRNGLRMN